VSTLTIKTWKRFVAFNCTPEILQFWVSEEAACIFQLFWTLAGLLKKATSTLHVVLKEK
jgi:hypothetical protein